MPFADFSKDAFGLRAICNTDQCCAWLPSSENWGAPAWTGHHVHDMAHCVLDTQGRWMIDWVGTAENFDADWKRVVEEVNRRTAANVTAVTVGVTNARGALRGAMAAASTLVPVKPAPCSMAQYSHMTAADTRNIGLQFSVDAVVFGYLPTR